MIALDLKKLDEDTPYDERIAARHRDIDMAQQASIEVDNAVLEIRDLRREEAIHCDR
jgi:hypothetical protein